MGEAAEEDYGGGQQDDDELSQKWRADGWCVRGGGGDVDPLQNFEVVVERDGAHGDGENHEPEQVLDAGGGGEGREEEVELREEAGERWDSGEREQEDEESAREHRRAAAEAVEAGEVVAAGLLFDDADDGEDADGSERVGDDVVEQRGKGLVGVSSSPTLHVAGPCDEQRCSM